MRISVSETVRNVAALCGLTIRILSEKDEERPGSFTSVVKLLMESCAREAIAESEILPEDEWLPLPCEGAIFRDDGTLLLPLPEDFLMLGSIMAKGWKKPLTKLTKPDSREYGMQFSSHPGLRGNSSRPRAFIEPDGAGRLRLRIFGGFNEPPEITEAIYLPAPRIGDDNRIGIPANLYREWLRRMVREIQELKPCLS